MSLLNIKPAGTYDLLLRQFNSLRTVAVGLERMLADCDKAARANRAAARMLDSEREANATMTAHIEDVNEAIAEVFELLIPQLSVSMHFRVMKRLFDAGYRAPPPGGKP